MATATLEDLIEYLKKRPSPFDMARNTGLMIEGLQNLAERLQAAENDRLTDLHRMQELESLTAEERAVLTSLEQDRDAGRKVHADLTTRVDTLEKVKPVPAVGPSAISPFPTPVDLVSTSTFDPPKPFTPETPKPFTPAPAPAPVG